MKHLAIAFFVFTTATPLFADDKDKVAYDPTSAYSEQKIEGWLVRINKKLDAVEQKELREQTLKLLDDHLYRITRVVPAEPLEKLRKIPIWMELAHPKHPCMCYHVSKDWLASNGMNPEKAGGVELANCKNFLSWTKQQPWMVLHELAHGYHHQVLGVDHAGIKACFTAAKEAKIYDSVLHIDGSKRKHYALTNTEEYFAEMTEAYFGTNDFYPFVRAELKQCDPRMYELLEKVWSVKPSSAK
jgi:hypothetical protein